jgi:hypothetical protein
LTTLVPLPVSISRARTPATLLETYWNDWPAIRSFA